MLLCSPSLTLGSEKALLRIGMQRHYPAPLTILDDDVDQEYQWSELVPPHSALTFAVIWDPADDYIAFSDPDILQMHSKRSSQHLQLPQDPLESSSSAQLSTRSSDHYYEAMEEPYDEAFISFGSERKSLGGMTQTSSTLGGLDVYLKGSLLAQTHRKQPVYSVLDFGSDFHFEPLSTPGVHNIYQVYLSRGESKSQLMAAMESGSFSWTALEAPSRIEFEALPATRRDSRKRLKKRRPSDSQKGIQGTSRAGLRSFQVFKHLFISKKDANTVDDWIWIGERGD